MCIFIGEDGRGVMLKGEWISCKGQEIKLCGK